MTITNGGASTAGHSFAANRVPLAFAIATVALATLAAAILGNGNIAIAVAPVLLVGIVYFVCRVRLRSTAALLLALLLSLDITTDAAQLWHSPLVFIGDLFVLNLDQTVGVPGLKLTGLELVLLLVFFVWLYRKVTGSTIDASEAPDGASVITDFVVLYVASLAFAVANGLLTGGTFAIWQIRQLLHTPLLYAFFRASFRGSRDRLLVGRVIVFAALVKAGLAVWVKHYVESTTGPDFGYATNHGDSILFALAIAILVVQLAERATRRHRAVAALLIPPLVWGTYANNRRLAFIDVCVALIVLCFFGSDRRWKRTLRNFLLVATPIVLLYLSVGWDSSHALFRPVRTIRTLTDSHEDRSTLWREVENWNISVTMRDRPLLGLGLGKEYVEHMKNDDVSTSAGGVRGFPEYRLWPHNSVLGLLLFGGVFAFTGLWSLFGIAMFLAIRSLRETDVAEQRIAGICALCAVLFCIVQAYGDGGAPFTQYRVFTGLALAVTGNLAVETGAWPSART